MKKWAVSGKLKDLERELVILNKNEYNGVRAFHHFLETQKWAQEFDEKEDEEDQEDLSWTGQNYCPGTGQNYCPWTGQN